ncbi:hypothetical protein MmTuc01_2068 [Methanosarcina mazei Tuc01]|uniref:Uncharacterized protein n=1 Tax=Methanosarcina mazei Tuc01 TaxID=1236903 RepID=M1Q524_METMZ|nr:hypothetical protein MmTuc01_2068 [Methanosarcina mazei Tuc01]
MFGADSDSYIGTSYAAHKSLRLKIESGNRKWFQRTPAMAEGITDHIWSLKELLTFRVPVQ